MPDGSRTPEAERKAKSRANKREMEEAGLFKFPSNTWIDHKAMEALYDVGERLGTKDPAEILNAVFLTLQENPRFMVVIEKSLSARCHRDTSAANAVVNSPIKSIMNELKKGGRYDD